MTIFSVGRDYGPNISIVRITTDSTFEEIVATGWLGSQIASLDASNGGGFQFNPDDVLLIYIVDDNGVAVSAQFFTVFSDFQSVDPLSSISPNLQNITAFPGGGQANATPLNIGYNYITTAATTGASVLLPMDVLGQQVVVVNRGANSVDIYPQTGDYINNPAAPNIPLVVAANTTTVFYGMAATGWFSK